MESRETSSVLSSPTLSSPTLSSSALSSPPKITQYSKKTGRPIRRSAGRVSHKDGYVDSAIIEDGIDEPIETPSEDEDGEPIKQQRKRKRTPSPIPPPLDPVIRDDEPDDLSDDEVGMFQYKAVADRAPITLQFNIPLGFHGPLMVKLDRNLLSQLQPEGTAHNMQPQPSKRRLIANPSSEQQEEKASEQKKIGFTDLPPELRNKVYRHLFVTGPIAIPAGGGLCRSSQFLSTCKLVHSEGCSILYGENKINLSRNRDRRGAFWESVPREIGYTDSRRFLKVIGPENLAYLRDVKLMLEDACPSATPYLNHEQRRYVNDEHIIDILRILGSSKLREFTIAFHGRRALARTDTMILRYLERIQADEVSSSNANWYYPPKIPHSLWQDLKDSMTRSKKLYVKDQ
ncbi:hypothetical protein P280DRAFT_452908 [Massarina eburnea CBS 473.64]|uniref:Uncharacterized protein n=1 Tax=Massarina eburnea CBS 473.64 TaxID=1395130 RepID=A0A6A6RXL0_9PLEO|nr:hypothetical protein P280DRAFT_452908 [Massarina eburnea CBS 473.64]